MENVAKSAEHGFTLTEVMVSLMIFMVASMGLLPLLHGNLQANRNNRLQANARRFAAGVMAELQVVDYTRLTQVGTEPWQVGDIEIRQQIEPNLPRSGQTRITVTAVWASQRRSHSYRLQTIRSAP